MYEQTKEIRVQEVKGAALEVWDTIGDEQFFGAFYGVPHLNCYIVNADNMGEAKKSIDWLKSTYSVVEDSLTCVVFTCREPSDGPVNFSELEFS